MSNEVNRFYVPTLKDNGCWRELRTNSKGGKDWRGYRSLSKVSIVWGHHTVTHPIGDGAKEVEVIRSIHMGQRGWGGIGYNFIITSEEKNGYAVVYQIGDIGSIRAHTPNSKNFRKLGKNTGNVYGIGISVIGMNHLTEPTDAQYRSYHELLKELIYNENVRLPKLKTWDDWQPHWAGDPTACYGKKLNRDKVIKPPKLVEKEDPKVIKELQEQVTQLNTAVTNMGKDIEERDTKIENLENALGACKEKMEEDAKAYEGQIETLVKATDKAEEKHQEELKNIEENHLKEIAKIRKLYDDKIVKLNTTIEELQKEPEPVEPTPEPQGKSLWEKLLDLLIKTLFRK